MMVLAQFFGTSTGFWMNGQMRWDLYHARKSEEREIGRIKPYEGSAQVGGGALRAPRIRARRGATKA